MAKVGTSKFTLSDIKDFPEQEYQKQLTIYRDQENWFAGVPLDEETMASGKPVQKYPLRINPIISTVLKHAYILFGEVTNNGKPLVYPTMIVDSGDEKEKKLAKEAEDALNMVWWENNGRSLMFENGILSQIYGGCVFKASYVPWEEDGIGKTGWRQIPIRIERVNPKSFIGRPNAGDMFRLREAWVVSDIPFEEAKNWGYAGLDATPTFVEHWTREEHSVKVNEYEISFPTAIPDFEVPFAGNPFGFVPIVYIPHVRIGRFHGINAFDHLKGVIRELNARFADFGDAVNDDSHVPIGMRNVTGSPQLKTIADGIQVLDLGSSTNITGNESEPDLFEIHKARASSSMQSLVGELIEQYRRDSFVPAVAEGEDEGSQRSALTLATRFWPLTSHVGIERIFFSSGMDVFNTYLLKMMAKKGLYGITEEHTKLRMKQSWAPMLPRDRQAEVQEWAARAQNNMTSVEHLMELMRDVDDVAEMRKQILDWIEDVAEVQAKVQSKYAPTPFGVSPSPGNTKPGKPPVKQEKTVDEKVGGGGGSEA